MLVVSDHGAKRMDGGIRVNEWLRREGLLTTLREPHETSSLADVGVDWSRTVAWGEGGYYARIFLNVQGREPEGIVAPEDYERVRADLLAGSRPSRRPGQPIGTQVVQARGRLPQANGVAARPVRPLRRPAVARPSARWAATRASIRSRTTPDPTTPTTPRTACDPGRPGHRAGRAEGMHLLDVAPTVLDLFG